MGAINSITIWVFVGYRERRTFKELSYEAQIIVLRAVLNSSLETVTLHKEEDWVSPVSCVIFIEKSSEQ